MNITVEKSKLEGEVVIPPSKSHTIRALVLASFAEGRSVIHYPLDSGDTKACIDTCRLFGAKITLHDTEWIVTGMGSRPGIPDNIVDVKNSGTTLYIALGMGALCKGWTIFTGDDQIRSRPATHLLTSLNDLGAEAFSSRGNGCAPIVVKGILRGGKTSIECPSSQYLTSLLINCPLAEGDTEIDVIQLNEVPYVTMTMNWLDSQGINYTNDNYKKVVIKGGQKYMPFKRKIPADFSSATFFLCAAAITQSRLTLHGLDMNDPQGDKAVVEILKQMGCKIYSHDDELIIEGGQLHGGEFDLNNIPDSLPALSVTACFAGGTTRLYNVAQARLKETDRISIMRQELEKMGASVEELPDGLVIKRSILKGTQVHGHADHRVVMALTIAGLGAEGRTTIDTIEAVDITFPDFFTLLKNITL